MSAAAYAQQRKESDESNNLHYMVNSVCIFYL
jgi:hypothetical protein